MKEKKIQIPAQDAHNFYDMLNLIEVDNRDRLDYNLALEYLENILHSPLNSYTDENVPYELLYLIELQFNEPEIHERLNLIKQRVVDEYMFKRRLAIRLGLNF